MPTKILTDNKVRILAMAVRENLGEPFVGFTDERLQESEDIVLLASFMWRFKDEQNRPASPKHRLRAVPSLSASAVDRSWWREMSASTSPNLKTFSSNRREPN